MSVEELKELQKEIKAEKEKHEKRSKIIVIIVILITYIIIFSLIKEISLFLIIFSTMIALFIGAFISIITSPKGLVMKQKKLSEEFKNTFVRKALNNYFDNLEYNPDKGLDESSIREKGLLSTGDWYSSNDYVSGTYNKIKFERADIHIEKKEERKNSSGEIEEVWVTQFKGPWMIFDFNKKFKFNLIIQNGYFINYLTGEAKRIETEDVSFNKEFSIYATDEHEAFYILTPNFMEKIKKISKRLGHGRVRLAFNDSKLHIGINSGDDLFEYNFLEEINEAKIEEKFKKDIKVIIDLIDDLDLTNDLFKE